MEILVGLTCLWWILFSLKQMITTFNFPKLEDLGNTYLEHWPKLSVVVAACNEQRVIKSAINSLQTQVYPALEIIIVNDRSTDTTGQIIEELKQSDDRIVTIHIDELPPKWLGKVNAFNHATKVASGDWILYTDADILFGDKLLKDAVAIAVNEKLDHLTLLPKIITRKFWLKVLVNSFALFFFLLIKPHKIADPSQKESIGVGAFNLVRKSLLDKTQGLKWLQMELADDLGLGMMIKQNGGRSKVASGYERLEIEWYNCLGDMIRGLEKNSFAVACQLKFVNLWVLLIVSCILLVGPIWGLMSVGFVQALSIINIVLYIILMGWLSIHWKRSFLALVFTPIGFVLMIFAITRSAFYCWRQQGIYWRGTKYCLNDLRNYQRVKIP